MEEILNLISLTKNNLVDIRKKIDNLETNLNLIESSINQDELVIKGSPLIQTQNSYESILDLAKSPEWPNAIEDYQILDENSEEEKQERAEGIINFFVEDEIVGKKFLDIGCGEGHTIDAALKEKASLAVGYDIKKQGSLKWEEQTAKSLLTTDSNKVRKNGPYDIILIYDVIDHIEGIHPVDIIATAKQLLNPKGKIHIRFHPWCSRHGGHIYRDLNKAFAHFILNKKELKELGIEIENHLSVFRPVSTYKELISQCGLEIISENIEREQVENFFKSNDKIKRRILNEFDMNTFPEQQMEMCFIDFVLSHK